MSRPEGQRRRRILLTIEIFLASVVIVFVVWLALRPDEAELQRRKAAAAGRAMRDGQLRQAVSLYRDLVRKNPESVDLRRRLTVCLLRLDRLAKAEVQARRMLETNASYAPAHAALSEIAERRGDLETAIAEARLAQTGELVADRARLRLATLLLDAGQTTEGIELLKQAVVSGKASEEAALRLSVWLRESREADAAGVRALQAVRAARSRARKVLEEDPTETGALLSYVALSLQTGESAAAIEALREAAGHRELTPAESLALVRAYAAAGDLSDGEGLMEDLETSLSAQDAADLRRERAEAWLLLRKPNRAITLLDALIAEDAEDVDLVRMRLRAIWMRYRHSGREDDLQGPAEEVEAAARAVLAVRPNDEAALGSLGSALLTQGRLDEALGAALQLREQAVGNLSGGWLHGLVLIASGHAPSALVLFSENRDGASETAPRWIVQAAIGAGNAEVAVREARALRRPEDLALRLAAAALGGDLSNAEEIATHPEFGKSPPGERLLAAQQLAMAGREDLARDIVARTESEGADGPTLIQLGDYYLAVGDHRRARESYEAAVETGGAVLLPALMRTAKLLRETKEDPDEILDRVGTLPRGEVAVIVFRGRSALERGEATAAEAAARSALAISPLNPDARALLLDAIRASGAGRKADLAEASRRVLEVAPGNAAARVVRAGSLYESAKRDLARGDLLKAGGALSRAVSLVPGAVDAMLLRGMVRASLGQLLAAEDDVDLLRETVHGRAAAEYLLGLIRLRQGRREDAIDAFRRSLDADPGSPASIAALGFALVGAGRPAEALQVAEDFRAVEPESSWLLRLRAVALADSGSVDEAVDLARTQFVSPEEGPGYRALAGWLLLRAGRAEEAVREFDSLVEERPDLLWGNALLVDALIAAGDLTRALEIAERTLLQEEAGPSGLLLRSRVRLARGDRDGALSDLREAERRAPDAAAVLFLMGQAQIATGNLEEARVRLEKAARLLPANARIRLDLGRIASTEGRVEDAVALYEEVLRLDPQIAVAANNLASHLTGRPGVDPERLISLARQAVDSAPENGSYRDTLSQALAAAGRLEAAIVEAERAVEFAPDRITVLLNAARLYRDADLIPKARKLAAKAEAAAKDDEKEEVRRRILALDLPDDEEE